MNRWGRGVSEVSHLLYPACRPLAHLIPIFYPLLPNNAYDWFNLCLNISMHILDTVFHTFPQVLTRRIWLGLKNFFSWWSFHLFSWPWYVIQGWYCKEKLNARHSKGSEVYVCSHSAVRLPISLPPSVPFQPLFLRLIHPPPPFRENLGMLCTTPYSNNLVTNCKFCFVFCHALVTLNSLAKEPIPSTSSGQRKTKRIKKQKITSQNSPYE